MIDLKIGPFSEHGRRCRVIDKRMMAYHSTPVDVLGRVL